MEINVRMMKMDTAKCLVSGIVDINGSTINVDTFKLPKGINPKQAMKELSDKAVRSFKALDVKWVDEFICKKCVNCKYNT